MLVPWPPTAVLAACASTTLGRCHTCRNDPRPTTRRPAGTSMAVALTAPSDARKALVVVPPSLASMSQHPTRSPDALCHTSRVGCGECRLDVTTTPSLHWLTEPNRRCWRCRFTVARPRLDVGVSSPTFATAVDVTVTPPKVSNPTPYTASSPTSPPTLDSIPSHFSSLPFLPSFLSSPSLKPSPDR